MNAYLEDWFAYNREANHVLFQKLSAAKTPPKASALMGHILVAHRVWLDRLNPVEGKKVFGPWHELDASEFESFNETLYRESLGFVASADMASTVRYTNSKGETFTSLVSEILFHLMTHSAYHRGQVNLLLRQSGEEPVLTDYIFYKRDGKL